VPRAWLEEGVLGTPPNVSYRHAACCSVRRVGSCIFQCRRGLVGALASSAETSVVRHRTCPAGVRVVHHDGGVSNVDIDGNNTLEIKAIGVVISTFETRPAYALLNKPEESITWLEKVAQDGFPCYPLFERDANWNNLRKDARFTSLLASMKQQWERYRTT